MSEATGSQFDADEQIYLLVGKYALGFGSLEHSLCHAILRVEAELYPMCPLEVLEGRFYELRLSSFASLCETLSRLTSTCFTDENLNSWRECLAALKRISVFRNRLMHNYSLVADGCLTKMKRPTKSDPLPKDLVITPREISNEMCELQERSLQLYGSIWTRYSPWQSKYEMLPMPSPKELCGERCVDPYWAYEDMMGDRPLRLEDDGWG